MRLRFIQLIPFLFVWLWSTGFIGAKYGLPYIEPFYMLFVRFCISIGIFFFLIKLFKAQWLQHTQVWQQMMVGMLIHGGYLGGVFFAIKEGIPAGIAAIIVGLQPIVTTLVGVAFLQQRIDKRQALGLVLGFSGVTLVIGGTGAFDRQEISTLGITACLFALMAISMGTVLQKRLAQHVPLLTGSVYQYIGAALFMALLTYPLETQQVNYSIELFAAMAWLIFGLSVLAILLLLYMIREGEVAKITSYFYLVPPAAVFQSWLFFDEKLGVMAIVGCICTMLGVYCVVKTKRSNTTHT